MEANIERPLDICSFFVTGARGVSQQNHGCGSRGMGEGGPGHSCGVGENNLVLS